MPATGKRSTAAAKPLPTSKDVFEVLVTGFSTYSGHPGVPNPSHLITASLPKQTTLEHPKCGKKVIKIAVHEDPVPAFFANIDALVPKFYEGRHFDFVLHTGVAPGISHYEVETHARRAGYKTKDDSGGKPPDGEHQGFGNRQGPERFETCAPEGGIENLLSMWKNECKVKEADLRISRDAGLYVCEYITYASLAYLRYQKNHLLPPAEQTGVAFLHAPTDGDDAAVARGREVYVALIKALVLRKLGV